MKLRQLGTAFAATALAATLALTGCSSSDKDKKNDGGSLSADQATSVDFPVKSGVNLPDSPTFQRMKKAGKVVVGVKEDQPGWGYLDPISHERTGFDVLTAQWLAASLGFPKDKIEYKSIPSASREQALQNGDVDYYVGTYSITDKRKKLIDFAGPYFITGQGLLVKKDNQDIKSDKDLKGKTVCSATGSTPIQNIRDNYPDTKTQEFDTYSQCVEKLKNGQVDAVTTDQAILLGYAAQDPDNLKVVGEPFTVEKYGVGVPKGDNALKSYFNQDFKDGHDTWQKIYDATLGKSGTKVEQPQVEDN